MKIKEICLEIKQFHKFGTKKELALHLKGVKIPNFDKSVIFKYYMHDLSNEQLEEAVSIELDKLGKKSANNFLEVIGIK